MKKLIISLLTIAVLMVGSIDAGGGHGGHGGGHRGGHHGGWRGHGRGGFWGPGVGIGLAVGGGYPYYSRPYPVPVAVDAYDVDPYTEYINLYPGAFDRFAYRNWLFRTYPSRASYWWGMRFGS